MTTLADKAILSGADNRPPMLEKDIGPLIWPSIVENRVIRPKKYSELSATEALQVDCDIKATNIILPGLPHEERECKLYDEFDKFAYKKGESLREFYLRFSLLLNDMNIYNMKLEQFQVNIKFLNTLPLEWSKFVTDVKLKGDDPIDAINHMMSFLTAVVTSRTSRTYTPGASGNNSGKQRMVICYNCKGEGHMSKQCNKPKRKRDDSWFKDKVLLVQAQASGQILHEEELTFLADPGIPEGQATQTSNVVNHSETEITSDSNIISYTQYLIESQQTNLENKSVNDTLTAELVRFKEQDKVLKEEQNVDLRSHDNVSDSCSQFVEIDHLKRTLSEHLKEKESLLQTITILKNNFKKEESRNLDREISLEKQIKHQDNIVFKRDQSAQTVHMLTKPSC
ncbi:retrovirus-related pol polyprotein from transposon TNT 1-94 [Tanacetum coccineum]